VDFECFFRGPLGGINSLGKSPSEVGNSVFGRPGETTEGSRPGSLPRLSDPSEGSADFEE